MKSNPFRTFSRRATTMLLAGSVLALTACSSSVEHRAENSFKYAGEKVRDVSVAVAADVQARNTEFNPALMKQAIVKQLTAKGLMDTSAPHTLDVAVTEMRIRHGAAAVMLGPLAGGDYINGNVDLRGPRGSVHSFKVNSNYAWGGIAGVDSVRIGAMSDAFAERVVEGLTGSK